MPLDHKSLYQALLAHDRRFDGLFFVGVTSTGIYCRPSCPARTPRRANVRFFSTAAAAQGAGFRACMRCRPDAAPGSPEWDVRSDLVYFCQAGGGAVFSTGSIAWTGSLSHNGYDNNVARITGNVLRRFVSPEPLDW